MDTNKPVQSPADELGALVDVLLGSDIGTDTRDIFAQLVTLAQEQSGAITEFLRSKVLPRNPVLAMQIAMQCIDDKDVFEEFIRFGLTRCGGAQVGFWSRSSIATLGAMRAIPLFFDAWADEPNWLSLAAYYLGCDIPHDDQEARQYLESHLRKG